MTTVEARSNPKSISQTSSITDVVGTLSDELPVAPDLDSKNRSRKFRGLIPVEATVYWWCADEHRSGPASNKFSVSPATPVRFRCIGNLSYKYPKRYRVDLAQALDWLPELNQRELKQLGVSLATAISKQMGVDVAPVSQQVIDVCVTSPGWN